MRHRSPFVWVDGRPFLAVNFDLEPTDVPSLPEILERLLQDHHAEDILILRPLSRTEASILRRSTIERDREAWAQIVASKEDRYRGK